MSVIDEIKTTDMKALIQKKREIIGSENKEEIKTTWYFLCIPIFHSKVTISR